MAEADKPKVTRSGDSVSVDFGDGVKTTVENGHATATQIDMGGGKSLYVGNDGIGLSFQLGHQNKPGEKKLTLKEAASLLGKHGNGEAEILASSAPEDPDKVQFKYKPEVKEAVAKANADSPFSFSFGGPTKEQQAAAAAQIEASRVRQAEAEIRFGWLSNNPDMPPMEAYDMVMKKVTHDITGATTVDKASAERIIATAVGNLKNDSAISSTEHFNEFAGLAEKAKTANHGIKIDAHFSAPNGDTVGGTTTGSGGVIKGESKLR